jgi:hypothetical protein
LNRSDSWKTWGIIIGLLLFTGVASAAWLWFSNQEDEQSASQVAKIEKETEPITISFGDYVLGKELLGIDFVSEKIEGTQINPWLVVAAAAGIVTVFVGGIGLFLALITVITSRQVSKVYADEGFQTARVELNRRDAESLKGKQETRSQAASPGPQRRLRWSVAVNSILVLLLVWIAGLIFGVAFFGDTTWDIAGLSVSAVAILNLVLIVISLIVLALTIRSREPDDLDLSKTDNNPVNWSYVWVVLSGALIFGLGAGLAIAMSSISTG